MTISFLVGNEADLNTILSEIDLGGSQSAANTAYTITLTADILEGTDTASGLPPDLYAINLASGSALTIDGNNHALNGASAYRGLFVYAGTVTIQNLTFQDTWATGGAGGQYAGGGAGLGGGVFVAAGANVTLSNVTFSGNRAIGGAGGSGGGAFSARQYGGGGGLGGAGGTPAGGTNGAAGGGGIGANAFGAAGVGPAAGAGGGGVISGAAAGGYGGGQLYRIRFGHPVFYGSPGGADGGGGGGGGSGGHLGTAAGGGGGGGVGGQAGRFNDTNVGGAGGFGGGGGGAHGAGGFGGGGGAIGGNGGFGGGGGGLASGAGLGGYGAGAGGRYGGGGGLGAGGDIFVMQGGSLIIGAGNLSGGMIVGGTGGVSGGNGNALGSGIFIQGMQSVHFAPSVGQTVTISDIIADDGSGSVLVSGGGTVILNANNTYRGGTILSGGTLDLAMPGAAGANTIRFANGTTGTLQIDGGTMPANTIAGFIRGDTIFLSGLAPTAATATLNSNYQLSVPTSGGTVMLQLDTHYWRGFNLTAQGGGTAITALTVPCFAAGTRIATPRGMVAVERLRVGDRLLTVSGGKQRIQWIGHREVDCRRHPNRERVWPIRVAPHAFGEGRPGRAVLLSPDHSVFVEDVLIPIKGLVNDTTIRQIEVDTISYYHIELERHDVVLAEGLPAESYLETGGRHAFENAGTTMQLHPDFEPDPARVAMVWQNFGYAPLLGDGSQLQRARQKLALQAALLGQARASAA